jgi:hypothetical protein
MHGQVAVVTGASSGIGLAIAKELRALGLQLVLTARSEDRIGPICSELGAAMLVADITDATVPDRLLATALERFGRCDVVVNNAGSIEVGPIESIDVDKVCRHRRRSDLHRAGHRADGASSRLARSSDSGNEHSASVDAGRRRTVRELRIDPACSRANPTSHDSSRRASDLGELTEEAV